MLKQVELTNIQNNFGDICEEVSKTNIPVVLKCKSKQPLVLLSYKGYRAIEELFEMLDLNEIRGVK